MSENAKLRPALLSRAEAHDYFSLMKRLEQLATKNWLVVMRDQTAEWIPYLPLAGFCLILQPCQSLRSRKKSHE